MAPAKTRSKSPAKPAKGKAPKAPARKPKKVSPIPKGYRSVTPYLVVRGGAEAIAFYREAFGAKERMRMPGPDGTVAHAELVLGDSVVMLSDEMPMMGARSPASIGGTAVGVHLYVKDVDQVVARATSAGAKVLRPLQDQFYGDRTASLEDPFGHNWHVATHVEDVSPKEMARRAAAQMPPGGAPPAPPS